MPHHDSKPNSFIPGEVKPAIKNDDQLRDIKGKHPAYKHALFYRGIQAHTYFISHGKNDNYQHPHRDVVTGILIAAVTEKKNCNLVVTGTFHPDIIDYPKAEKYQRNKGFPQNWQNYVDILVPENREDTPYITITGDGVVTKN